METRTTSNQEVHSEMLSEDDKSNQLILFSLDRPILMNPVCLGVLQDVFIEFSEVNASPNWPSSEPLISCSYTTITHEWDQRFWQRPMDWNVNLTEFNKKTSCRTSRQTRLMRIVWSEENNISMCTNIVMWNFCSWTIQLWNIRICAIQLLIQF